MINFFKKKNPVYTVYIIGIEGAGTSALAEMYINLGYDVSGSDENDHFYYQRLKEINVPVFHKFDAKNVPTNVDLIVYSTWIPDDHPELVEAKKRRQTKLLSYPEALGELFKQKLGIAVCGTHGKTTTTALLAEALKNSKLDPSAIVGSRVINWKGNSLTGKGEYFAIEADEYQNKLKYYDPWSVILTSVDFDHPDFFQNMAEYKKAFSDFVAKVPKHGFLIYCNDDADVVEVSKHASGQKVGYGFTEDSAMRIVDHRIEKPFQVFRVKKDEKDLGEFKLKLPGKHNALNATAVIAIYEKLNLDLDGLKKTLENFEGTERRFQYIGERNGATLIDDYAHHPEEVKATLKTARELYPEKEIITVFHPHSFTRTEALLEEFSQCFEFSDKVIVIDIYGSARENSGNVSSEDLVNLINKYQVGKAEYVPTVEEATEYLKNKIGEEDLVISMGAGDVWRVTHSLKQ